MRQWELLEPWFVEKSPLGNLDFTQPMVAEGLGISGPRASALIQAYAHAWTLSDSPTLYIVYRSRGRTIGAEWRAVINSAVNRREIRARGAMYGEDCVVKWKRDAERQLSAMGVRMPDTEKSFEVIASAVEGALQLLTLAASGGLSDD